jgi:hypothetical protein
MDGEGVLARLVVVVGVLTVAVEELVIGVLVVGVLVVIDVLVRGVEGVVVTLKVVRASSAPLLSLAMKATL